MASSIAVIECHALSFVLGSFSLTDSAGAIDASVAPYEHRESPGLAGSPLAAVASRRGADDGRREGGRGPE